MLASHTTLSLPLMLAWLLLLAVFGVTMAIPMCVVRLRARRPDVDAIRRMLGRDP
jgi:hypothetical protein